MTVKKSQILIRARHTNKRTNAADASVSVPANAGSVKRELFIFYAFHMELHGVASDRIGWHPSMFVEARPSTHAQNAPQQSITSHDADGSSGGSGCEFVRWCSG